MAQGAELESDIPETVGKRAFEVIHLEAPGPYDAKFLGIRSKTDEGKFIQSQHGYVCFAQFEISYQNEKGESKMGELSYALPLSQMTEADGKVRVILQPTEKNKIGRLIMALGEPVPAPGTKFDWHKLLGKSVRLLVLDDTFNMKDGTSQTRSKVKDVLPPKASTPVAAGKRK